MTARSTRTLVRPIGLIFIGSLGNQVSALLAASLFVVASTVSISTLRFLLGAVILLLVFRPNVREMSKEQWKQAFIFGASIALMNQFLYAAIARIPLGAAITIDFLGPCCVTFFGIRQWRIRLWALVALAGVALIAGPSSGLNPLGVGFALCGAAFCALYTIFAEKVGKSSGGMGELALSITIAALLTLPFSIRDAAKLDAHSWMLLALAGFVGVAIPYMADTLAARFTSAQIVGTLFAIEPVLGTILGVVFRGDVLTAHLVLGILCVTVAGVVIAWFGASPPPPVTQAPRRWPEQ